ITANVIRLTAQSGIHPGNRARYPTNSSLRSTRGRSLLSQPQATLSVAVRVGRSSTAQKAPAVTEHHYGSWEGVAPESGRLKCSPRCEKDGGLSRRAKAAPEWQARGVAQSARRT